MGRSRACLVEQVHFGDQLLPLPGEKVPTDGVATKGTGTVDECKVTGKNLPISKWVDDEVIGRAVYGGGSLCLPAMTVGSDTALAQSVQLMQMEQNAKASVQRLADNVAENLVIAAGAWASFLPDLVVRDWRVAAPYGAPCSDGNRDRLPRGARACHANRSCCWNRNGWS